MSKIICMLVQVAIHLYTTYINCRTLKVAEFLNDACINFVENTDGKNPLSVLEKYNVTFSTAINTILEEYKYQPSLLNIRKYFVQAKCFSLSEVIITEVLGVPP